MTTAPAVPAAPTTWEQEKTMLPPGLTEAQMEAIRRAGAQRRHNARVDAARSEIRALCEKIVAPSVGALSARRWAVHRLLREAIEVAIASIGKPGSACGTSPPGWYRNTRNVGARVAALRAAMAAELTDYSGAEVYDIRVHVIGEQELVIMDYQLDDPTLGRINPEWGPEFRVLAEHIASMEIQRRSSAMDAWIASGGEGQAPAPPPAELIDFYYSLMEARRGAR